MAPIKIRLLIAEDEDIIRNGIEKYIRGKTQYVDEIFMAADGREALDMIYRLKPQVMLLDIHMPHRDGLSVLKEASAAGVCPVTLILSGHDEFHYAQQAIRYSVADYLLKPCRNTEILQKVDDIALKLKQAAEETPNDRKPQKNLPPAIKGAEAAKNPLVAAALEYIEEHYSEDITLGLVAGAIGVNPSYLSTLFTRSIGMSFVENLNRIRIARACDYFEDKLLKTYEVAYLVGFHDEKYFSNVFSKVIGISPSEYRKSMGVRKLDA